MPATLGFLQSDRSCVCHYILTALHSLVSASLSERASKLYMCEGASTRYILLVDAVLGMSHFLGRTAFEITCLTITSLLVIVETVSNVTCRIEI